MNKYVLTIAYNGAYFGGWQSQQRGDSVCELLEATFYNTFKQAVWLVAASRTDVGVHALGQVVLAQTELALDPQRLAKVWNDNLPPHILIRHAQYADINFHPWYNVYLKTYYYHIAHKKVLPVVAPFVWFVKVPIDMEKVIQSFSLFSGTHDFKAFKHAEDMRTDTVRTINHIECVYNKRWHMWTVVVVGNRFMRHMIRRMVGSAVTVGARVSYEPTLIQKALSTGTVPAEFVTAPAQGLVLRSIRYKK